MPARLNGKAAPVADLPVLFDRHNRPLFRSEIMNSVGEMAGDTANFPYAHYPSGYGTEGASWEKNSLKTFTPHPGDADADITFNIGPLRARSRQLFMSNPIAAAIIQTLCNYVIADGIRPQADIDGKRLGFSKKKTADLNKLLDDEFALFAEEQLNDWNSQNDFYGNQELSFRTMLMSGDCPVLMPIEHRPHAEYDLKLRLLESDRVCNPFGWNFETNMLDGVEYDPEMQQVAVHVRQVHPGTVFFTSSTVEHFFEWVRVPFRGAKTGRKNVLMLIEPERPEQRRGVPLLAKVLAVLKQSDRFMVGHIDAKVVQSFFTAFIESEFPDEHMFDRLKPAHQELLSAFWKKYDVAMSPGMVNFLRPGSKVTFPNLPHGSADFEQFMESICRIVGACVLVPHEILMHNFKASYSASRAALNAFELRVDTYRARHVKQFSDPVRDEWMGEAMARGVVSDPRYFDDIRVRRAWNRAIWHGRSIGSLDPEKEAKASRERIIVGTSSVSREAARYGGDWRELLAQREQERAAFEAAQLPYPAVATPVSVTERIIDQEGDEEEQGGGKSAKEKARKPGGSVQ